MKQLMNLLLLGAFVMCANTLSAQNARILNKVFTDVNVQTDVQYGTNYSLLTGSPQSIPLTMDVYTPDGDTADDRPLIILMHSGSFLPPSATGLPFGTKGDSALVELCTRFAKRGWVAASATYRLGWNPNDTTQELRAKGIIRAVYLAMQDAKACIRYFKKEQSNYGIDPNKICIGGTNSGAYIALAANSLNDTSELMQPKFLDSQGNPFINQAVFGDFDGDNGTTGYYNYNHPGYSSDFQLVLSLGGDVGDTSWLEPGENPIVAFHGVEDQGSPFFTATVFVAATQDPVIEVSGPGDFIPKASSIGLQAELEAAGFAQGPVRDKDEDSVAYEGLYPFYGEGFEPWGWYGSSTQANPDASKSKAMKHIDTIVNYFSHRAYRLFVDSTYTGIQERKGEVVNANILLTPNPASDRVQIHLEDRDLALEEVRVYNISGKLVRNERAIDKHYHTIDRKALESGIYLLSLRLDNGKIASRQVVFD